MERTDQYVHWERVDEMETPNTTKHQQTPGWLWQLNCYSRFCLANSSKWLVLLHQAFCLHHAGASSERFRGARWEVDPAAHFNQEPPGPGWVDRSQRHAGRAPQPSSQPWKKENEPVHPARVFYTNPHSSTILFECPGWRCLSSSGLGSMDHPERMVLGGFRVDGINPFEDVFDIAPCSTKLKNAAISRKRTPPSAILPGGRGPGFTTEFVRCSFSFDQSRRPGWCFDRRGHTPKNSLGPGVKTVFLTVSPWFSGSSFPQGTLWPCFIRHGFGVFLALRGSTSNTGSASPWARDGKHSLRPSIELVRA